MALNESYIFLKRLERLLAVIQSDFALLSEARQVKLWQDRWRLIDKRISENLEGYDLRQEEWAASLPGNRDPRWSSDFDYAQTVTRSN